MGLEEYSSPLPITITPTGPAINVFRSMLDKQEGEKEKISSSINGWLSLLKFLSICFRILPRGMKNALKGLLSGEQFLVHGFAYNLFDARDLTRAKR